MEPFWKGTPDCSCVLVQLTYTGTDQSAACLCLQMPIWQMLLFLPRFKYFLYLDPLVTSEPGYFWGLLKKYLLFLGEIYFKELENSLYLLCNQRQEQDSVVEI